MKDLETFIQFVDEITASNSRKYKQEILEKYKTDKDVLYFLFFLHNPYVTTGISTKKLAKPISPLATAKTTALQMLEHLSQNNTGRDETLAEIKFFEQSLTDREKEIFEKVICKNLPLGIDTLTINKIVGDLIPTFNIMLANKYFDKPEIVEGKEFTITTKIDGGRIVTLKKDGKVRFYTRAGQEYEGLVDIQAELEALPVDNFMLDGEITLLDANGLNSKEQYKQTMMITRRDGEKHGVKILAFDYMPVDSFETQYCSIPYWRRRKVLEREFSGLNFVAVLPALYSGSDTSMIMKLLNEQTAKGEEGVMININTDVYDFKRTNSLLKVKKMQDVDLEVVGVEEGTNKNAGRLGAFIVDYKGNKVKVGSGISQEIREEVWKHPEDYIGLTISVQYFEETKNQAGGVSLRFPVFLDFRYDL